MTSSPLTVYYDGACPACRREVAVYQRMRSASRIRWVDAATCKPDELGQGLDPARAVARFHARLANGQLVSGASAFIAVWRNLHALGWLGHLFDNRLGRLMLNALYAVFLRIRPLWRQT